MEKEIVALGLTGTRITEAYIDKLMEGVKYYCHVEPGSTTTVIKASIPMYKIDFTLAVDIMACIDPDNFNAGLGEKYGIEKLAKLARDKLWELEGYHLAKTLTNAQRYAEPLTAKDRLSSELDTLDNNRSKLTTYTNTSHFKSLDAPAKYLLVKQSHLMTELSYVLHERLTAWKD